MESTAARLLHLLSLFSARPAWNATELAERLGVTPRTVRRDVAALRDLGYPVESDAGRTGGYRLGIGGRLPPLLLTEDEAVSVALGLRVATVHGLADDGDASVSALAKLEQVLPPALRERVLALHGATDLVERWGAPSVDPEALLALAAGCRRHERVTFIHRPEGGVEAERRVEPYRLVSVQRRWYAVVWDLDRRDWRTFRVDRIRDVTLTGHTFTPVEAPDAPSMVVSGIAAYPYDVQAEVVLHLPIDAARGAVPPTHGTLEERSDGRTLLRIGGDDCEWLARYLAGLGCGIEVLSPPELAGAVRALGERLAAVADPG